MEKRLNRAWASITDERSPEMIRIVTTLIIWIFMLCAASGCQNGKAVTSQPTASIEAKVYRLPYIRDLKLSYTTAEKQFVYNEHLSSTTFPENTSGVILRFSGEKVPEGLTTSVSWYYVKEHSRLLCSQQVSSEELNKLQYVDLSLYQHDTELPAGQYEVVIEDNRHTDKEKLTFSIK